MGGGGGGKHKGKGKGKGQALEGENDEGFASNDDQGVEVVVTPICEPLTGRNPCYRCSFWAHQGSSHRASKPFTGATKVRWESME